MRKVSPVTWVVLVIGVIAIPWLWLSGEQGSPDGVAVRRDAATAAPPAAPGAAEPAPLASSRPPLEAYTAIVERPLFNPMRRAPSPPLAGIEAPGEPLVEPEPIEEEPPSGEPLPEPSLRLVGTLVDAQGQALAIVEQPGASTRTTLALGDALDGWRLESVGNGSIEIRSGDRLVRIGLKGPE